MARCSRGFTLVELMIVVLLMGLMLAYAVPALRRLGNSQSVKGAKENIISQVQLARAKAISTGIDQPLHFYPGIYGWDYHVHTPGVAPTSLPGWKFPKGVSYGWATTQNVTITMKPNGTAEILGANMIPLMNLQGVRDTVVIMTSGIALSQ